MKFRSCFFLTFAASIAFLLGAQPAQKLEQLQGAPKGFPEKIAAAVSGNGLRISGSAGPMCELWLAKNVELSPGFKPSLSVKYPFVPGAFVGAMRVLDGAKLSDFREQPIAAGMYTLRYAQQPMDGNHLGTSETSDFLLAVPAAKDDDPATIKVPAQLHSKSVAASGTTHPAIFSLLPPPAEVKNAAVEHDDTHDFWILNAIASGTDGGKATSVPLRLVVLGHAQI